MATSFSQVKPSSIKMKVQVRYPGSIVGQDSIKVTTANGIVTIESDYASLQVAGGFPSASGGYVKGWDPVNGYYRISYDDIEAGAVSSAAAAAAAQAAAETAEAGAEAALAAAEAIASTGVLDVTAGFGVSVTGTTRNPIVNVSKTINGSNLLPNSNWQLFSTVIGTTSTSSRVNVSGNGLRNQVAITGFTPSSGRPTLTTTNTQDLVEGDIVVFGTGHGGLSGWAHRIFNLVPNTSFQVQIPFGLSTPSSSSAQTAFPCGIYNSGTNSFGPDGGWTKTSSLAMWADDWVANRAPGAKRVLGLRKTVNTGEAIIWRPRNASLIADLRGRTVSLGMLVRQKVGGTSAKIYVNDGTTVTYSSAVAGSSYSNTATNNYQFLTVSATISKTATFFEIGYEFNGSTGDISYIASPTLKYGVGMSIDDLGQDRNELIRADTHWNPPCLVPFTGQWPGTEIISGSGLYGWSDIDLEAISYCQCHNSVCKANSKIEYTSTEVGSICFVAALDIPAVQLTFGLQASISVASATESTNMSFLPLINGTSTPNNPPGCWATFSNKVSGTFTNITFDFDDVIA